MAKTPTETENKKVKPKVELWSRWTLERKCFDDAKIRDIKTGKWSSWPYMSTDAVKETSYNQFLDKITDPDTGYFYPKRDGDKVVKTTPDNIPKYVVRSIIRLKRLDNSEFLLSKGNLIGHDALGREQSFYLPWYERWSKTNFSYESEWDNKRKRLEDICKGPGGVETIYTLPFNEENLKSLFDKRQNDNITFVVKEEQSGGVRQVSAGSNINDTFKLFLKPFDYLFKAEYIPAAMKAQYRQEAIDAGLLAAPSTTGVL